MQIFEFQFHNGTINTSKTKLNEALAISFNSTTVQLIRLTTVVHTIYPISFQFHNGTINTFKKARKFKFTNNSFNSTTVQLIHTLYPWNRLCFLSFNSTTVQLIL